MPCRTTGQAASAQARTAAGRALGDHVERARDEAGPAQARLAHRPGGRLAGIVTGAQAAQVHHDRRRPDAAQRPRRDRDRRRADPLAHVRQAGARAQAPLQGVGAGCVVGHRVHAERVHDGVRRVVAEEVRRDPIRHAQRPRQEWAVGVLDDEEPTRDERRQGTQARPTGPRSLADTGQLEGQPDAGAAPRHVVVEVAVEALEPGVEVRRQRHQQELQVQELQVERARQAPEPKVRAGRLGGVGFVLHRGEVLGPCGARVRPQERAVPAAEEMVHLGVRDVQAAEPVLGVRVAAAPPLDGRPDPVCDEAQARGEVTGGGVGRGRERRRRHGARWSHARSGARVAAHPEDAPRASRAPITTRQSLGVFLRGRCPASDVLPYWGAQLLGAAGAAWIVGFALRGAPVTPFNAPVLGVFLAEFLFTFALVYVVLNVATADATDGNSHFGLAIGFTVLAGAFAVGQVSGAAFNPAVAFGASIRGLLPWSNLWLYIVAELLGGAAAAFAFKALNPTSRPRTA